MANLINRECLEQLLQAKWSEILDRAQVMRKVMEFARDTEYRVTHQDDVPPKQVRLSITKFEIVESGFVVWIEFNVPKNDGVIVGTHVCSLSLSGELELTDSYGTHFVVEKS